MRRYFLWFQVGFRYWTNRQDTWLHWELVKAYYLVRILLALFYLLLSKSYLIRLNFHCKVKVIIDKILVCTCTFYRRDAFVHNLWLTTPKCFCRWLQGNSFEGPIPPTFSNLTSLIDLWVILQNYLIPLYNMLSSHIRVTLFESPIYTTHIYMKWRCSILVYKIDLFYIS